MINKNFLSKMGGSFLVNVVTLQWEIIQKWATKFSFEKKKKIKKIFYNKINCKYNYVIAKKKVKNHFIWLRNHMILNYKNHMIKLQNHMISNYKNHMIKLQKSHNFLDGRIIFLLYCKFFKKIVWQFLSKKLQQSYGFYMDLNKNHTKIEWFFFIGIK